MTAPGAPPPAPELVLDCRGMRCPLPVIVLARRIAEGRVGAVVAVLAEDPAAVPDVAAWARLRGHTALGTVDAGTLRSAEARDPDGTARTDLTGVPAHLVRRDH